MTTTPKSSEQTRAHVWVDGMCSADNDIVADLGENFQFLLNHHDEYESGTIEYTDLPNFNRSDKWIQWQSVRFGTMWQPDPPTVYRIMDNQDGFVGLYGHEENAVERVADTPSLSMVSITPEPQDVSSFIEQATEVENPVMQMMGTNLDTMYENPDILETPGDLPHGDMKTKEVMVYSVIFGQLWELSFPALYAVLDTESQFYGLYSGANKAKEAADPPTTYVQRVAVVDGDLSTAGFEARLDRYI